MAMIDSMISISEYIVHVFDGFPSWLWVLLFVTPAFFTIIRIFYSFVSIYPPDPEDVVRDLNYACRLFCNWLLVRGLGVRPLFRNVPVRSPLDNPSQWFSFADNSK